MKKSTTALLIAVPAVMAGAVFATSTGTNAGDFQAIETVLTEWLEGTLGTVIALGALGVGLAIGVTQQSIMAAVIGISMALAVSFGPGVLTSIAGAGFGF